MKKEYFIVIISLLLLFTCGCSNKRKLDVEQLRDIAELITLEEEYHNVATVYKESGTGLAHFGEVDRKVWVEYVGVVKIGVDADKIKMNVKGKKVKIKMPKPAVLFINYRDYDKDSYYISKDSWFNNNKVSYTEINAAMEDADNKMLEKVNENQKMFDEAKNNLEALMINYIDRIGELNGIKYEVKFSYY